MIAIAGAKGGCGKTTTTVGLADAFARAGVLTLLLDADRQLPNLHLAVDVDREPTIASLSDGADVSEYSQEHPETPKIRVLPAPKPSEEIDLKAALAKLNHDSIQTLVDCPAGVGPDAVDPIVASDQVLVVTTNTKQSLNAAQKTIDTAERAGVPIAGVVLNQCSEFGGEIPLDGELPFVQPVPEVSSPTPHREPEVRNVHRSIVATLLNERLATGIEPLDEQINGGVSGGTLIGVSAESDARSELLLHALSATRHTLYLTTERSEQLTLDRLNQSALIASDALPDIRYIGGDDPLTRAETAIESLPHHSNLIIDSMDRLEQSEKNDYISLLNRLSEVIQQTGSIAMLHLIDRTPASRNRSTTKQFTDLLLRLEKHRTDGEITHQLSIPTSRIDGIPSMPVSSDLF